jgi:hypothetical protein
VADALTPSRKTARRRKLPALAADAGGVARMLGVSKRSVNTYDAAGLIPRPFRLSGRTLWNVRELRRWLDAGSPDRATWEQIKAAKK